MRQLAIAMFSLSLVLAYPHPAPSPTPNSIKYLKGDKCLAVGAPIAGRHPTWEIVATNCDNATTWAEGLTKTGGLFPKISTVLASAQNACLSMAEVDGMCNGTFKVIASRCPEDVKVQEVGSRYFWDESAKLLRSQFCMGMCVDLDVDSVVLKDCAGVKGWSRQGSSTQPWFVPKPLPPGRKTGRYHMTWPFTTRGGLAVVGIDTDGYPGYFGSNNAEICPEARRYSVVNGKGVLGSCKAGECKCKWPETPDIPLWHGGDPNGKTPGTVAQSIKRSEIVQRAIAWVVHGFGRDGDDEKGITRGVEGCSAGDSASRCPEYFHGGACCSMPTMAWNVSSSSCLRNSGQSIRVDCQTEMKPGDAVSLQKKGTDTGHNFPSASHIVVFRKWTDDRKKQMLVFEAKGKRRYTQYGFDPKHMYCMKRKNIIEDVQ